jgi:uncharacterized protein involved in exopolysaccharide biosynthesis
MNEARYYDEPEAEGGGLLESIPAMLADRKWWIIIPLIIGAIAAAVAYFVLPTVYRSQAVLLVQSSTLPQQVTQDGSTEVVDRRIARIRQQILSRPDLVEMINKHALYRSERERKSLSQVIEDMRDAIVITPTVSTAQQNGSGQATISFTLTYDYSDPIKAQAVAQELTEQILELDSEGNARQATGRVRFLTDQARGLEGQIADLESQIAAIKAANGTVLSNSGIAMIGGNSGSYDVQIGALQRENSQLLSQRELAQNSANRDPVVLQAEAQLAAARAVYADNHPDVAIARQRLAQAQALASQNVQRLPVEAIDQQIAFNATQIAQLRAARDREMAQMATTLNSQSRAPLVLQQISQLQQRLENLNDQYQGVSATLLAAQAGARAEDEQMGERLTVVDPPVVPDKPVSPKWWILAGLGIGGGLGAGFVLAFLIEFLLRPIRSPAALPGLIGNAFIVVVPTIRSKAEEKDKAMPWYRRWFRRGGRNRRALTT